MPDSGEICPSCGEPIDSHLTACPACGRDLISTATTQPAVATAVRDAPHLTDFEIIRTLGRGGMGTVYEAYQVSMHRRVALKVLGYQPTITTVSRTSLRKSRRNYVNAMALDEKGDEPEDDGDQVISGSPMDQTSRVSPLDATPQPLSLDEAKELIRLCETGRLYEVEVWIAAGKSLTVPNGDSIVVESWSESDTCPPAIPCGRWQEWQWK